jgi:outer membrane cobalamin receptor
MRVAVSIASLVVTRARGLAAQSSAPPAAATLCVRDELTQAPLVGATLIVRDSARTLVGACASVYAGPVRIVRGGYREASLTVSHTAGPTAPASTDTLFVSLRARSQAPLREPQQLATQQVVARADTRSAPSVARVTVADARERGAGTTSGLLTLLPFTQLRSARGETGVSLRGARREQVVITLDGVPLNDPATGLADISDIPLASVAAATVAPGADPIGAGMGASGGVLALSTQAQQLLSVRASAFGGYQAEVANAGVVGTTRWHGAASWRTARNDFAFVNDAGVAPTSEHRANNDERRLAISGGLLHGGTQLAVLASTGERGMVGPANVRSYDADRSRTDRAVVRVQQAVGATTASLGLRAFRLAYRDPTRPALDSRARAWAADADWRGSTTLASTSTTTTRGTWRAGVGADGLTASGQLSQQRVRGFAAYQLDHAFTTRVLVDAGVRTDVVERHGVQPVGSAGLTVNVGRWRGARVATLARVAQAIRVPTLYDLYFANPQRLYVRPLDPERVTLDASAGLRADVGDAERAASAEFTLVSRDTRNAIVWFPGNFGWSPANVGLERLRGIEAKVGATLGVAQLTTWLTAYEATLLSNGLHIPTPYVPRVASGTQLRVQVGGTVLSANTRYQGRRPYTAGPQNAAFELPAVWLVDGAVSHHWLVQRTDVLVTAALDNATDAHWQSVRGFPMPGPSWSLGVTFTPARRP